jgi:hypothetical protein
LGVCGWPRCRGVSKDELRKLDEEAAKLRNANLGGAQILAKPEQIADARIATRRLPEDGKIILKPNAEGTAVCGEIKFRELGEYVLEVAGLQRRRKDLGPVVAGAGFATRLLCCGCL